MHSLDITFYIKNRPQRPPMAHRLSEKDFTSITHIFRSITDPQITFTILNRLSITIRDRLSFTMCSTTQTKMTIKALLLSTPRSFGRLPLPLFPLVKLCIFPTLLLLPWQRLLYLTPSSWLTNSLWQQQQQQQYHFISDIPSCSGHRQCLSLYYPASFTCSLLSRNKLIPDAIRWQYMDRIGSNLDSIANTPNPYIVRVEGIVNKLFKHSTPA